MVPDEAVRGVNAALASTVLRRHHCQRIRSGSQSGIRSRSQIRSCRQTVNGVESVVKNRVYAASTGIVAVGIDLLLADEHGLLVLVADKIWVIARRKSDTLATTCSRTHTLAIIVISVWSAAPRSLVVVRW